MSRREHDLYTIPNAAKESRVPLRTLYYAVKVGFIKPTLIDGKPFVTLEAIAEWQANPDLHKPGPKNKP